MILEEQVKEILSKGITRTCGGDPQLDALVHNLRLVLPAHAGVILQVIGVLDSLNSITRTCGGDPKCGFDSCVVSRYYPHMRG